MPIIHIYILNHPRRFFFSYTYHIITSSSPFSLKAHTYIHTYYTIPYYTILHIKQVSITSHIMTFIYIFPTLSSTLPYLSFTSSFHLSTFSSHPIHSQPPYQPSIPVRKCNFKFKSKSKSKNKNKSSLILFNSHSTKSRSMHAFMNAIDNVKAKVKQSKHT